MIYPSADASHMLALLVLILCLCASTVLKHVEAVAARPQPRLVLSMSSSAHANGGRRLSDIAAADPEDAWHPEVSCGGVQVERAAAPSAAELLNLLERDLASQAAEDHAHTVSCKGYGKNKGKGKDNNTQTNIKKKNGKQKANKGQQVQQPVGQWFGRVQALCQAILDGRRQDARRMATLWGTK